MHELPANHRRNDMSQKDGGRGARSAERQGHASIFFGTTFTAYLSVCNQTNRHDRQHAKWPTHGASVGAGQQQTRDTPGTGHVGHGRKARTPNRHNTTDSAAPSAQGSETRAYAPTHTCTSKHARHVVMVSSTSAAPGATVESPTSLRRRPVELARGRRVGNGSRCPPSCDRHLLSQAKQMDSTLQGDIGSPLPE